MFPCLEFSCFTGNLPHIFSHVLVKNGFADLALSYIFYLVPCYRDMAKFIARQIEDLGAELCYHKFLPSNKHFHPMKIFTSMTNEMANQPNHTYTNFGMNTIGIIRAPRGDGKEAIVLVTPYNSQRVHSNELLSLALGFSIFSLLSRAPWLSKDIVWLSADSQFGEYSAVSSWLNQYHNPAYFSHSLISDTKMYGANHRYDANTEQAEF
jgi:GPI-anchor transamidase subunit GAA1